MCVPHFLLVPFQYARPFFLICWKWRREMGIHGRNQHRKKKQIDNFFFIVRYFLFNFFIYIFLSFIDHL